MYLACGICAMIYEAESLAHNTDRHTQMHKNIGQKRATQITFVLLICFALLHFLLVLLFLFLNYRVFYVHIYIYIYIMCNNISSFNTSYHKIKKKWSQKKMCLIHFHWVTNETKKKQKRNMQMWLCDYICVFVCVWVCFCICICIA